MRQTYASMLDAVQSLAKFQLLPYTDEADAIFKSFRSAKLRGRDGRIAAHALSLGFVLVTENLRDFDEVAGLMVENWAEAPD